jgi:hypothetical protein
MFTLPVWDILSSYTGDSKQFSFSGEIFDGYFEDISFLAPLDFRIQIIALDDGVEVLFDVFHTRVHTDEHDHDIDLTPFGRTWKKRQDPLQPDDICLIDTKNMTIDLAPVIREEILMACHMF